MISVSKNSGLLLRDFAAGGLSCSGGPLTIASAPGRSAREKDDLFVLAHGGEFDNLPLLSLRGYQPPAGTASGMLAIGGAKTGVRCLD